MVFPVFKDFTGKMVLYLEISVKKQRKRNLIIVTFFQIYNCKMICAGIKMLKLADNWHIIKSWQQRRNNML